MTNIDNLQNNNLQNNNLQNSNTDKPKPKVCVIATEILLDLLMAFIILELMPLTGTVVSIGIYLCLILMFCFFNFTKHTLERGTFFSYTASLAISLMLASLMLKPNTFTAFYELYNKDYPKVSIPILYSYIFGNFVVVFRVFAFITSNIKKHLPVGEDKLKKLWQLLPAIAPLAFILTVYIPTESFVNNIDDFNFTYQKFAGYSLLLFLCFSLVSSYTIAVFVKAKHTENVRCFMLGLTLAVYVQYMFMNKNLDSLGASDFNWGEHTTFAIVNALVWLAVLILPFAVKHLIKVGLIQVGWKKLSNCFFAGIGALHLLSCIMLLICAPSGAFSLKGLYFSPTEQFVVSQNKNIVMFIFDAVDNYYIRDIIENSPETFDGLEDFTLYTNTCSVYDSTARSIPQMLGGGEFNSDMTAKQWHEETCHGERATEFFGRLHNAGYKINGFNLEDAGHAESWVGDFDNIEDNGVRYNSELSFDRATLNTNLAKLVLYRTLPFYLKKCVNMKYVSFSGIAVYNNAQDNYKNKDFYNSLNLSVSDTDENYMIVQHLYGAHYPSEDFVADTKYCLEIAKKYIADMKELGVYDDATIILASDHGAHNVIRDVTPMFLIKEPNTTHDTIQYNNAPIYHTDIQSTILTNAGLFDADNDKELFGASIYDFKDGDKRTRVFGDRAYEPNYPAVPSTFNNFVVASYNVYYLYTFTSDSAELNKKMTEQDYTIYPMTEFWG